MMRDGCAGIPNLSRIVKQCLPDVAHFCTKMNPMYNKYNLVQNSRWPEVLSILGVPYHVFNIPYHYKLSFENFKERPINTHNTLNSRLFFY